MGDVCGYGFLSRKNQLALQWKDRILIFGGWTENERPCAPNHVQVFFNGTWRCVKTGGRIFAAEVSVQDVQEDDFVLLNPRTARVVGDKVYVMGTMDKIGGLIQKVCVLDLTTWSWSDLTPKGNAPIMVACNTSWLHREKIYVYGGFWRGDIGIAYALNYSTGHHETVYSGDRNMTNQGCVSMLL